MRALCEVAAEHDLTVISDEIYGDLIYEGQPPTSSPAVLAPERTVVTTGLSKNLALGGWRIGVARLPDSRPGRLLQNRLLGVASEIWSVPSAPVQHAAAYAFAEPAPVAGRIAQSRRLHAAVAGAVAGVCAAAGLVVPAPQAAFYLYPDFEPWREHLRAERQVTTAAELAAHLLQRYGAGTLPASAFGEDDQALRLRLATSQLYGDGEEQQEAALNAENPVTLPWISAALARLRDVLADLRPAAGLADVGPAAGSLQGQQMGPLGLQAVTG